MARKPNQEALSARPAPMGSVPEELSAILRAFSSMMEKRDEILAQIMGTRVKPSAYRSALLREIVMEFADGRIHGIAAYQKLFRPKGSPNTGRKEILFLVARGLLAIVRGHNGSRRTYVVPTVKLVEAARTHSSEYVKEFLIRLPRSWLEDALERQKLTER